MRFQGALKCGAGAGAGARNEGILILYRRGGGWIGGKVL